MEVIRHTAYLWLAAFITLGIYSFLYSDNKLYRVLLNGMIGLGVGYGFMITWIQVLGPKWWDPMKAGFAALSAGKPWPAWSGVLWVFVGLLGVLWYFQFSRKYLWLSRIVMGIAIGAGAGVVFKQQFLLNMPLIMDSARPILATAPNAAKYPGLPYGASMLVAHHFDLWQSLNNILYLATVVSVMVYFFFSFSHDSKAVKGTAKFGRWMLMISFGAFFGNTIMTRMGVFLQRLQFLTEDWAPREVVHGLPSWVLAFILGGVAALIYGLYTISRPPSRPPSDGMNDDQPVGVAPGTG